MAVAAEAGEGQIHQLSWPFVLSRNNMVYLKSQAGKSFRELAILTAEPCATPHLSSKFGVHYDARTSNEAVLWI